jgi:hypothetical protein
MQTNTYTPLANDTKSLLYKMELNGPLVNQIQDYIYPSRRAWKTAFSNTLEVFTRPRDVVLLYECGVIPSRVTYEWVDRLPGLINVDTELVSYRNDQVD